MIKYPLEFLSETSAGPGMSGVWKSKAQANEVACCVPVEFLGSGGGLSPEDLFNQALTNCFVATFKVYAENSKLSFENVFVNSKLIVDLNDDKKPVMKSIHIQVKIKSPSNSERALVLAKKAADSGFVLNSVKTEKHFSFEIV